MIGYKRRQDKSDLGFTLIEMVVVIGIFSIVLIIIASMLTRFSTLQRRSIAEQTIQSDLRFALEMFNREVRTGFGSTYGTIGGRSNAVIFRNQNSDCIQYRFRNNAIERAEVEADTIRLEESCANVTYSNFFSLTKEQTIIDADRSRFFPSAAGVDENGNLDTQGFVMIEVIARTNNQSVPDVNLKSTVTSRQVISFDSLLPQND